MLNRVLNRAAAHKAAIRRFSTTRPAPIRYGLVCSAGIAFTMAVTASKLSLDAQHVPEHAISEANPAKARYVAFDEVQQHTSSDSCWVIIEGQVYE